MAVFEGARLDEAKEILGRYPEGRERSAIMPLLYLAQSVVGHISRDGLKEVAELLDLTTAEVEAVASFYSMYRLRPTGTHVVSVCTNLACMLRGARDV
jgi:NADH-quinone oxidoreductase subunit E